MQLSIHSPVEPIENELFRQKQIEIFIKRDDLIHPFISGNKWRKLKYTLADARSLDKTHLVSFGGAFSNHLLAFASAGAKFGFKTTGIIRGDEPRELNHQLFLCKQFGMNFVFVARDAYRNKELLFEEYFKNDRNAYFVNEGGSGPLALPGCAELLDELHETYDHIFLACGTGSTLAGIAQGAIQRNLKTQINGIPVLKGAHFLENDIKALIGDQVPFTLHFDYHQGGYAKTNPEYLEWLSNFNRTGLLLDHVYTGKMMKAVFDLAENDYFQPNSKILTIHTGGLIGLLGLNK
ncbi:1-aminocyclopropane-1-carboxylate deaminase/D-cysteine desulfhydrase [Solitalea canadensis]|uniref:1-aminocyclopropane-1-carboxylate deaminase n=1 Tax=Solitalea canadensis (strain ATCC 29591 / DSM 3403 / JCM 21819 / LMG 8368 / NBRC 15130 / NCIMB 12057 / USAM 9D) TaxID=929556 RepID=H8KRF4_SOLCM|nr:pyridoxal-phosphate dependent enzyme [Solitalea canadensis]AFD07479.1 1-aminocyclopropane-1-carboxylate deaminase [Solitalea canadensis DSM 3403]